MAPRAKRKTGPDIERAKTAPADEFERPKDVADHPWLSAQE
jgi:hypothetical protein